MKFRKSLSSLWRTGFALSTALCALSFTAPTLQAGTEPTTSAAPYWYFDSDTECVVALANDSAEPATVKLTVLLEGRRPLNVESVTLPPRFTARVSLNEKLAGLPPVPAEASLLESGSVRGWGTGSRVGSRWGSLVLRGDADQISAWVLMTNSRESLAANSMASSGHGAQELVTQFWRPTPGTGALFAVQNVGQATSVDAELHTAGETHHVHIGVLKRHEARLLTLEELARRAELPALPDLGSVRFLSGSGGELLARTVLSDASTGFSTPLMAHAPSRRVGNELQTPGMPFGLADPASGFPEGTSFSSTLLATNTSTQRVQAKVFLQGTHAETSEWTEWPVAVVSVEPGETLDTRIDIDELDLPIVPGTVGVRVRHERTAAPDALVADLVTTDQTLSYSFFDPLFDTAVEQTGQIAISFDLAGSKNTHLVLKNVRDSEQPVNLQVWYVDSDGNLQVYSVARTFLQQELDVFDLKSLRDQQTPGDGGRVLPLDLVQGFAIAHTGPGIVMGDPTFDVENGTCSSCSDTDPGRCWTTHRLLRYDFCSYVPVSNGVYVTFCQTSDFLCPYTLVWWYPTLQAAPAFRWVCVEMEYCTGVAYYTCGFPALGNYHCEY